MSRLSFHFRAIRFAASLWGAISIPSNAVHAASHHATAREPLPEWLGEAAALPTPAFAQNASAVVLLDEGNYRIGPNGERRVTQRWAVRVLDLNGRETAVARVRYFADHQKIIGFEAWLIGDDGEVIRSYRRRDAIDVAADRDQVHTSARTISLSAIEGAQPGRVFGFSCDLVENSGFLQQRWRFQGTLPVVLSRCRYELPTGWGMRAVPWAGANPAPLIEDRRWTWEQRDLPALHDEPWGPPWVDRAAAVALDVIAPKAVREHERWPQFDTWEDVSRFIAELHDPRAVPDGAVRAKASELTAAAQTPWEKIRALARFVAGVNYASIQLGTGHGGGYTPQPASGVLRRQHGDCKDKTVLMRALLDAIGVRSFSVLAIAQDRRAIVADWPSPRQFDHCMVALAVDASVDAPGVIEDPTHGRWLIFDPTDSVTPCGELPLRQQGRQVLIAGGTPNDLVTLPWAKSEQNRFERRTVIRSDTAGRLHVTLEETSRGALAAHQRVNFRSADSTGYAVAVGEWLARSVRGARLIEVEVKRDEEDRGEFSREMKFTAPYFTLRSIVVLPALLPRGVNVDFFAPERVAPIVIEPHEHHEQIEIEIPAGFVVEAMPEPVEIVREFASYRFTGERNRDLLRFQRTLQWREPHLPPGEYSAVREFFAAVNRAEQVPVVLKPREP